MYWPPDMQASIQFVLCWGLVILWTHLPSVLSMQTAVRIWHSDPFADQSHPCFSSCPSVKSSATSQWSSQYSAEPGLLYDWSPASKIFLPWREQPGPFWEGTCQISHHSTTAEHLWELVSELFHVPLVLWVPQHGVSAATWNEEKQRLPVASLPNALSQEVTHSSLLRPLLSDRVYALQVLLY